MNASVNTTSNIRLDKYLWAVRIFKTRTLSAEACDKGKVKYKGHPAKAAKAVHIGDEYEIRTETRRWRIQVTGLISQRVQYAEAIQNYLDLTPAEELERLSFLSAGFHTGKRISKIGRPTKKQRRDLDSFNGL